MPKPNAISIEESYWVPSIGDPTIIGWITVFSYFIAAFICFNASTVSEHENSIKKFWLFLTFILVALGFNKQLDLQTLLTHISRDVAIYQGWYEHRRIIQLIFIIILSLTGLISLFKYFKILFLKAKTTLIGSIILFCFILFRAGSFYHINILEDLNLQNPTILSILELTGLAAIAIGGLHYKINPHKSASWRLT